MKLVFIVVCPGLSTEFKPEASHFGRRDALARICTSALYSGYGAPHPLTKEIILLFEDGHAIRLSPEMTAKKVPVPNESKMILALKS